MVYEKLLPLYFPRSMSEEHEAARQVFVHMMRKRMSRRVRYGLIG